MDNATLGPVFGKQLNDPGYTLNEGVLNADNQYLIDYLQRFM